jgi:hypothetical protein
MKKLLLTCGVVALLSGASAYAQAGPTQQEPYTVPDIPTGLVVTAPVFSFSAGDPAHPLQVEVDFTPTSLFAVATEDKDVVTNELITFNTLVNLDQTVDATNVDDFAEASAMGVQINSDNRDCSNCAEKTDTIGGSGTDNAVSNDTGLMSVNQAAGNHNNQGTLVSAAVDLGTPNTQPPTQPPPTPPPTPTPPTGTPASGSGFAHAQAEATQTNGDFGVGETGSNIVEAVDLISRAALIQNAFNDDDGLVYGNQATGNNNNQLNELSLAFSERPQGVAIAESDLGQFNTENVVGESGSTHQDLTAPIGINKSATIDTSLNGDEGIFGVNQAVGNNGNQANIVSVAAVGTNLPSF